MEKDAAGCPSLLSHTGSRTPAQAVPRQPPTQPFTWRKNLKNHPGESYAANDEHRVGQGQSGSSLWAVRGTDNLTKTECCGNWICDDEDKYVMFSYAHNSCYRNHRRYTLCGGHFDAEHEGKWQDCPKCRENFPTEMYVDHGTNKYNFEKLTNPPTFEPTLCSQCGKVIHLAKGGYSTKGGEYSCMNCSSVKFPGFSSRKRK